jgi:hypothetical protein
VSLGTLAILRGKLAEVRVLLGEALHLSLATRGTLFVTLCPGRVCPTGVGEGDPDRAALLEDATDGLRRRVGQPTWHQAG